MKMGLIRRDTKSYRGVRYYHINTVWVADIDLFVFNTNLFWDIVYVNVMLIRSEGVPNVNLKTKMFMCMLFAAFWCLSVIYRLDPTEQSVNSMTYDDSLNFIDLDNAVVLIPAI